MKFACQNRTKCHCVGRSINFMITSLTEAGDIKATIAVLEFIISSAAKYSVDGQSLSSELQQLGLPKEHAVTLCKCYEDKQGELQEKLKAQSMRLSRLAGMAWRVDYILSSSVLLEVNEPSVQLKLNVQDGMTSEVRPVSFTMTNGQLHVMLMGKTGIHTSLKNNFIWN
uniref:COMM domain containing 4 n=1 Tax=Eptatretus burgeri TaxID=7764 RepID=A0A8C4NIC7_EPTBU